MIIKDFTNAIYIQYDGFHFNVYPSTMFKGLLFVSGGGPNKSVNAYVRSSLGAAILINGYVDLDSCDFWRLYHHLLSIKY